MLGEEKEDKAIFSLPLTCLKTFILSLNTCLFDYNDGILIYNVRNHFYGQAPGIR